MNELILFILSMILGSASLGCLLVNAEARNIRGILIGFATLLLGAFGLWYSWIPESEYRKSTTEEIKIVEFDNVQWGILPTEPKSAVNLNEYFGRIISKDETVQRINFKSGVYRKFLYKNIPAKLEVIKLPKYHKNGLAMETIL